MNDKLTVLTDWFAALGMFSFNTIEIIIFVFLIKKKIIY